MAQAPEAKGMDTYLKSDEFINTCKEVIRLANEIPVGGDAVEYVPGQQRDVPEQLMVYDNYIETLDERHLKHLHALMYFGRDYSGQFFSPYDAYDSLDSESVAQQKLAIQEKSISIAGYLRDGMFYSVGIAL